MIRRVEYNNHQVCGIDTLYESGIDPRLTMKIVGHTDYQTTANIYTHVRDEMLKKATVNMNEVFQQRTED